jgi:hypothetical protein
MSEWKSTACILCECNCGHASGRCVATGVSPNELTRSQDRDRVAGTPWHKHTPARVEAL